MICQNDRKMFGNFMENGRLTHANSHRHPSGGPSLVGNTVGCTFSNRCFRATDECLVGAGPEPKIAAKHDVRCFFPGPPSTTEESDV